MNQPRLPRSPHLPGTGTQPESDLLAAVVAGCPPRTDPDLWHQNTPYLYGWRVFQARYYWEAHEIWEAVWSRCLPNSPERLLLQALIQIANALLKRRLKRNQAAIRIRHQAGALLEELNRRQTGGAHLMGVDFRALNRLIEVMNAI